METAIQLFNSRQFFACHEAWEELWTHAQNPRRTFLQALIHFAVGLYHWERRNPDGAVRQLRKGLAKLSPFLPICENIDTQRLFHDCSRALEQILAGASGLDLPVIHLAHQPAP